METTTRPCVVHSAMNDIKKKKISFKHKLQRREGVWTKKQKSLLIDSLLKHYPTNPIYLVVEEGEPKRVIDGLQRLSTIKSYVNDEFTLSTLDDIEIDGVPRKLSGKKFSELDPAVKEEISSAEIVLCELRDATDKDIIELFSRINNGKPLNSTQKLTTFMSVELIDIISSMVENLFFNNILTEKQLNDSVDVDIIIESLMMIDSNKDRQLKSFTAGEKRKFAQYYSEKFKEEPDNQYEKMDKISEGLNRLGNHFEKDTKMPKLLMPLCIYGMYRMIKDNKSFEKYFNWLDDFLAGYENNEEFLQYCNSGTTSAAKVQGRFQYFRSAMHDL